MTGVGWRRMRQHAPGRRLPEGEGVADTARQVAAVHPFRVMPLPSGRPKVPAKDPQTVGGSTPSRGASTFWADVRMTCRGTTGG